MMVFDILLLTSGMLMGVGAILALTFIAILIFLVDKE